MPDHLIEAQLFVGSEPTREHFQPVSNAVDFGVKPNGGMWTSTYDPSIGSGWIDWCHKEDFRVPGGGWRSWLLVPSPGVRVLTIDTLEDLVLALNRYPRTEPAWRTNLFGMSRYFDFEAVARDYDAIHLTEEGQWRTRLSHPDNLYGWDCESVLWLHFEVDAVEYLGRQTWREPPRQQRRLRTARSREL